MVRDRKATEQRILRAVGKILAEKGFRNFGINAVARQARVDKVLIYRYFGGLPELLRAYAVAGTYWPTVEEVAGEDAEKIREMPVPQAVATLLCNFGRAIRKRPVTLEILSWETVERNELAKVLEKVRRDFTKRLYRGFVSGRGRAGGDAAAIVTLLAAAINYLAVRSRKVHSYAYVDIGSETGWRRLDSAIAAICGRCLEPEAEA